MKTDEWHRNYNTIKFIADKSFDLYLYENHGRVSLEEPNSVSKISFARIREDFIIS